MLHLIYMETPWGRLVTSTRGLDFRLKYNLNREREGRNGPLRRKQIYLSFSKVHILPPHFYERPT